MIAQHPLFVQFIVYFNENQDYFECHEVLEELWKKKEPRNKNHWLVALILLSTGLYHWRRGNFKGAEKTLANAKQRLLLLRPLPDVPFSWNVLLKKLDHSLWSVRRGEDFRPFSLQLTNKHIHSSYENEKQRMALHSPNDPLLIHKHKLRDRTDVIAARIQAKKQRKSKENKRL